MMPHQRIALGFIVIGETILYAFVYTLVWNLPAIWRSAGRNHSQVALGVSASNIELEALALILLVAIYAIFSGVVLLLRARNVNPKS